MPYSFLGHTADMRMRVSGTTLEELFRDALLGMAAAAQSKKTQKNVRREVRIEAGDVTALLVDFLSEALMLMHAEREVYTGVHFKTLSEHSLEAELTGQKVSAFGEDVKAVTYHEAAVQKNEKGEWETNVVFDV